MSSVMDEVTKCVLSIVKQIIDLLHATLTSLLSIFRNSTNSHNNSQSNYNYSFFQRFQRRKTIDFDSGINATIQHKIAEGGFSYIYAAHNAQSPTVKYALKRIMCPDQETIQLCQNEAKIHRILDHHVNAMTLLGIKFEFDSTAVASGGGGGAASDRVCYMLFPLVTGGSLRDEVTKRRLLQHGDSTHHSHTSRSHSIHPRDAQFFATADILHIFHGLLKAVKAMHDAGYAHCDIKLENVMLDPSLTNTNTNTNTNTHTHSPSSSSSPSSLPPYADEEMGTAGHNRKRNNGIGTPILMDFGSARPLVMQLKDRKTVLNLTEEASQKSTVSYRAPELFDGGCRHGPEEPNVDGKVDVWSCGCLLYALMYGTSPFEMEFRQDGSIRIVECTHLRVLGGNIPFPPQSRDMEYGYSQEIKELVQWILIVDRKQRPDLDSLMEKVEKLMLSTTSSSPSPSPSSITSQTGGRGTTSSFDVAGVTRRAIV